MCVVEVFLLVIVEDVIGLADRLEFDLRCFSLGFGNLVRVTRKGSL